MFLWLGTHTRTHITQSKTYRVYVVVFSLLEARLTFFFFCFTLPSSLSHKTKIEELQAKIDELTASINEASKAVGGQRTDFLSLLQSMPLFACMTGVSEAMRAFPVVAL